MKKIYIEISDICGLKCSFCPTPKEIRGVMDLGLFKKAAFEARQFTKLITLHILGDPLYVKDLAKYLAVAKEANLMVEITTSGVNLADFNLLLQSPPIKQINFSLDALNELKSRDFLLNRIMEFCVYKRQIKSAIFINLRIQKRARNRDLAIFLENVFGVKNLVQYLDFYSKDLQSKRRENRIKLGDKIIIDFREIFTWNKKDDTVRNLSLQGEFVDCHKSQQIEFGTCFALKNHIGILANGEIVPCCMDFSGVLSLGNIKDLSIKSALSSPLACEMRDGFTNNRITQAFCKSCDYRKRFDS